MIYSEFDEALKRQIVNGVEQMDFNNGKFFIERSIGHMLMRLFDDEELYKKCRSKYKSYLSGDWIDKDGVDPVKFNYKSEFVVRTSNGRKEDYELHFPSYFLSDGIIDAAVIKNKIKNNELWDVNVYCKNIPDVINECRKEYEERKRG